MKNTSLKGARNIKTPFENDMLSIVKQAFDNLYPGKTVEIWWNLAIPQPKKGRVCGITSFCETPSGEGIVLIDIDPTLRVVDSVEVLAHELAHVAAGEQEGHGDKWAAAYDAIKAEYDRITEGMFPDDVGEKITVKSGKDYVKKESGE